jgi:hypothetical protein
MRSGGFLMGKFKVYYYDHDLEEKVIEADLVEVMGGGTLNILNCDWENWCPVEINISQLLKIESI